MNARDAVTDRVVRRAQRFPDLDLTPIETQGLSSRDAALAKAIDHVVARHWLTLAAVCDAKLSQPWDRLEAQVQAPLLVGAAQFLYLERVPDHAVVSEAVTWTKKHARQKAAGLVNAVLRRVAELREEIIDVEGSELGRDVLPLSDGRAWKLREPVLSEHPVDRLAQQTSHSTESLSRWLTAFGEREMHRIALHNLVQPPIILTGLSAGSAPSTEPHIAPHDEPGFFVYSGPREELDSLLSRHPWARVQDPATAHAISTIASTSGAPEFIIDLCAGKGTKTRQLAALFPDARIIATDVDRTRLSVLRDVFNSAERRSPRVEVIEFSELRSFAGRAELLVVDAPCSNSGVLARRVEAKYRLTRSSIEKVASLQRQILADAIPLLAPHGNILYITCSIEREENQHQARWLQRWHEKELLTEQTRMPQGLPGEEPATYSDGGYAALLK